MTRNPFGWDLPPGVTQRHIDEAAGGYDEPNEPDLDADLEKISRGIDDLLRERAELLAACKLFTEAAHDARDALNAAGIACPASIAFAAERARHAIRKAEEE